MCIVLVYPKKFPYESLMMKCEDGNWKTVRQMKVEDAQPALRLGVAFNASGLRF